jgi:CRISPR-associated endonuclease/helicase Cas3
MTFAAFFRALHGMDPFPWQERLAAMAIAGQWPSSIALPTAAGKTTLIDIAVYALAKKAPGAARRIFFVVDRRVIVDEAAEHAADLCEKLAGAGPLSALGEIAAALREIGDGRDAPPLAAASLRGGVARDNTWTRSPRQPLVVCSTVDQLGSSLLFRAYGTSGYSWPVRAALAAYDSLIILDEAHISQPFAETLAQVRQYTAWSEERAGVEPLKVVEMSATPSSGMGEVFRENTDDIQNPELRRRWTASKRASLQETEAGAKEGDFTPLVTQLVKSAQELLKDGARVIGVIANRVGTARAVHESLSRDERAVAILLTGRARPYDRGQLWEKWKASIQLGRADGAPAKPVFVVATQCIEVGANIDFDALVTEAAGIDALEQRFGRLNRGGRFPNARAFIVAQKDQVGVRADDPIYGGALAATWRWLKDHPAPEDPEVPAAGRKRAASKKEKRTQVEMGVLALRRNLEATPDRETLVAAKKHAPVLMPAHVDLLCQTSPEPAVIPEPALFLHGPDSEPADVRLIWRADLAPENRGENLWTEIAAICPPSAAEAISLPAWVVQRWLGKEQAPDMSDIEGGPDARARSKPASKPVLCWRGPDEGEVLASTSEIRPGMTLVVPAAYGGCDSWGWNPSSDIVVCDVGDAVKNALGRPLLRLHPELARQWNYADLATGLRTCESRADARNLLGSFSSKDCLPWVRRAIQTLQTGKLDLIGDPAGDSSACAALSGRRVFDQNSSRSAYSGEVSLKDHLAGCAEWCARFAGDLPEALRNAVVEAAKWHDIGKADRRFQAWLRGGNPIEVGELLAKSKRSGGDSGAIERARARAGYPKGGRHELLSAALLSNGTAPAEGMDWDLLLHLVASHHGRCRPFAPCIDDSDPVEVTFESWTASSAHGLERASSGVSERFWKLTRRYGWYGLAYLETLLRLSDHRRSEEEEKGERGKESECTKSS